MRGRDRRLFLRRDDRCSAGGIATGLYLGQTPPGLTPEIFAPGIISLDTRYEYSVAFSPDLSECVFGVTNATWALFDLLFTEMDVVDSTWSVPIPAPFQGSGDALSPAYSPDDQSIYFASARPAYPPANLWKSDRDGVGGWLGPVMVPAPVSTTSDEFAPAFAANATMYFVSYRPGGLGSGDIYRSVPVGGAYTTVEHLGAPINTNAIDSTPFVAPDESYMIFESNRGGGFGQHDLYISYNTGSIWGEPINLGSGINTTAIEDEPYVSPDGKYLFFNRRASFVTGQQTELWWVDIAVLPGAVDVPGEGESMAPSSLLRQNAPNPFHPVTKISYTLPSAGEVSIRVLDVGGREALRLVNRHQERGEHSVSLTETDTRDLISGTYFYQLLLDGRVLTTKKMTMVR